jgi:pilus assembly protein CpaE
MMPEMDGYEVARRLRADPRTQETPILMFTAKTQLGDKVEGFEVGADDYLTKPTSPSELQTHVRHLLEHAHERKVAAAMQRGRLIAVFAARGGLGVSSLASNLAAAIHVRSGESVILAELTPGQGTLREDLGASGGNPLSELLTGPPELITPDRLGAALFHHPCGVSMLLASDLPRDVALRRQESQFEALFAALGAIAPYIVLDLGSILSPWAEKILPMCHARVIVADTAASTITHTRHLIDDVMALGIEPAAITVVLNSRVRFESQVPWAMAEQGLKHPIAATFSPAPELMTAAARRHLPAVVADPDDVTSQQILTLADRFLA